MKSQIISECLVALPQSEIASGAVMLAGELPTGRIGLGYAAVFGNDPPAASDVASLSVSDAIETFGAIKKISGKGAVARRLEAWNSLLERSSATEQTFLRKLVVGELRQGALESLVADAVADAASADRLLMRRAVMLTGSLRAATAAAMTGGDDKLAEFSIDLFRPLAPMLASPADSAADALARHGRAFFEHKLDGARVQVHKRDSDVRVFTRNLRDVSYAVPEVVELTAGLPCSSAILDGEVIAMRDDGSPHLFQTTMRRFGRKRDVDALRAKLPLSVYFFDALHIDGVDLLDLPTRQRLERLEQLVPASARVERIETDDAEVAEAFFDDALARGQEGVMVKATDVPYQAGRRGFGWFKLKHTHTLDLVVVAVDWGSGRRKGTLSNIHLAARDGDGFAMIGKTFKGMTDDMLAWQTERFTELAERRTEYTVHVRPEQVVEVTFNDVQASPHYRSGYALRHARVKGYRDDKAAADADTIETVAEIYRAAAKGGAPVADD